MEGILLGIVFFVSTLSILGSNVLLDKTMVLILAKWPIIGSLFEWYLNELGDIGTGMFARFVYVELLTMAIIITYLLVVYSLRVLCNAVVLVINTCNAQHTEKATDQEDL